MKALVVGVLLILCWSLAADQTATTAEGRKVILRDNGTWAYADTSPATNVLTQLSGNGAMNTRPFTAPGPWEIQWTARGDIFQIFVYDGSGDLIGVAANQAGPGSGQSYQPKRGTYYLQVNALGTWTVRVVPAR